MDRGNSIFLPSLNMLLMFSPRFLSPSTPVLSSPSVVLFLLSAALVTGAPRGYDFDLYDDVHDPYSPNIINVDKVVDYYSKPQYAFGYEVDDYYNQLSHGRWEIRDGDVTQGQYRVLLPDGRIQIVSYIADKFGYRPTVEYVGKGAHPPPPPAYANVKVPKFVEAGVVPLAKPVAAPVPVLASPIVVPPALPLAGPVIPKVKAPFGLGGPVIEEYPVKIKVNSLPVNAPFPGLDPYAFGFGGVSGYGLDPAFAATNKISRKRALLYDRTLFRKDVEKRASKKSK